MSNAYDNRRMNADSIIYGSYVKKQRLDSLVYDTFSGTSIASATSLNIFVDLYSTLKPIFSEHYRIDTPALTIITSCLINLCGHYRSFFRTLRVNTNFYLIFSKNTSEINRKLVAGYNDTFKAKSEIKQYNDFSAANFDLLKLLCPYLPDIHFIQSTENYEVAVIIAGIIEKLNDGCPNLIISRDLYPLQLTAYYPYTSYLFPIKTRFGDESLMIPINEKPSYRNQFWDIYSRRHHLSLNKLIEMSPLNSTIFSAMTNFYERNINGLTTPAVARRFIKSVVGMEDVRIDPALFANNEEILSKFPMAIPRYNALDISYALPMYKMSPEYNSLQFVNLRDDAKINQICSMDVFVNNPIDLTQL